MAAKSAHPDAEQRAWTLLTRDFLWEVPADYPVQVHGGAGSSRPGPTRLSVFETMLARIFAQVRPDFAWYVTPQVADGGVDILGTQNVLGEFDPGIDAAITIGVQCKKRSRVYDIVTEVAADLLRMREEMNPTFFVVALSAPLNVERIAEARRRLERQLDRQCHILGRTQIEGLISDHLIAIHDILRHALSAEEVDEVLAYLEAREEADQPWSVEVSAPVRALADVSFRVDVDISSPRVSRPGATLWWRPGAAEGAGSVALISPVGADGVAGVDLAAGGPDDDPLHTRCSLELITATVGHVDLGEIRIGLDADGADHPLRSVAIGRVEMIENVRPRLIERLSEAGLTVLSQAYDRTSAGGVGTIGVIGIAGSETSRLCEEFVLERRRWGSDVISAKQTGTHDDPCRVLADLLFALAEGESISADPVDTVTRAVARYDLVLAERARPAIRSLFDTDGPNAGDAIDHDLDSVLMLLCAARGRRAPLIVHLQDLQRVPADVLVLLGRLVRRLEQVLTTTGPRSENAGKGILFIFEGRVRERPGAAGGDGWTSGAFESFLQHIDGPIVRGEPLAATDGSEPVSHLIEGTHRAPRVAPDHEDDGPPTGPDDEERLALDLWNGLSAHTSLDVHGVDAVDLLLGEGDDVVVASEPPPVPDGPEQASEPFPAPSTMPPQARGDTLEAGFMKVLRSLFDIDAETHDAVLDRLRRQRAGTQNGHDIQLDCVSRGARSRCHVECKNVTRDITVADVAPKVAQTDMHHATTQLDHWILISPRTGPTNELNLMLDRWRTTRRYPFEIQVWSPEDGLDRLIALHPEVYEAIYGTSPPRAEVDGEAVRRSWIARLEPTRRLPASVEEYRARPDRLCLTGEAAEQYDRLWHDHVVLRGRDEQGTVLPGSLEDQVRRLLEQTPSPPMLVLGDFGDGKSVFTYLLARHLHEQTPADGGPEWLVLRLGLGDFRTMTSPHQLLSTTLARSGISVVDWATASAAARTLVILDGIDEMAVSMDDASLATNLHLLEETVDLLAPARILATSRRHLFETARDGARFLEALGRPVVFELDEVPRQRRVQYLRRRAKELDKEEKLARILRLYDPIGLAAKPLFLEMISETLGELPDDTFDIGTLYRTYVTMSLQRKLKLLRHPLWSILEHELTENLFAILCRAALTLHQSGAQHLDLRTLDTEDETLSELLWTMTEADDSADGREGAENDARRRIGMRSLLKVVPTDGPTSWPVEFFHRSMREYFVALGIAGELAAGRPPTFLRDQRLSPEVVHFFGELDDDAVSDHLLADLEGLAHGSHAGDGFLGGNAVSLLYARTGVLPGTGWDGSNLDGARLAGVDLSGKSLRGSTLRFAVLDNADLRGCDLTGADLTGVRLEQGTAVTSLLREASGATVLATYTDGTLRRWSPTVQGPWSAISIPVADLQPAETASLVGRALVTVTGGRCRVAVVTDQLIPRHDFELRDGVRGIWVDPSGWLAQVESAGEMGLYVSPTAGNPFWCPLPSHVFVACASDLIAVGTPIGEVVVLDWHGDLIVRHHLQRPVSSLDGWRAPDGGVQIAVGTPSGHVQRLDRAHRDGWHERWDVEVGTGRVSAVTLLPDDQLAAAAADRSTLVLSSEDGDRLADLRLHVDCDGLVYEGVRGTREHRMLEALVASGHPPRR